MDVLWFYRFPIWLNGIVFLLLFLLAIEAGFRLGLRRYRVAEQAGKALRGDVVLGSMLALLGLMLAFTYSFSLSRSDMRKHAVAHEANAIGSAFLIADLGSEPGRSDLRRGLLEYAETRAVARSVVGDELNQLVDRSLVAQSRLWPAAMLAIEGDVPPPLQAAIVRSVTEVLDAHTLRLLVVKDRIPLIVITLLLLTAVASLSLAAQNAGLAGRINRWRMSSFALVLAALMLVIVDFDRGQEGYIRVDSSALDEVIRDMALQLRD